MDKADEWEDLPLFIRSILRLPLWWITVASIILLGVVGTSYGKKWLGGDAPAYSYSQTTSTARRYTDLGAAIGAMVGDIEGNCRRGWMERWWRGQRCTAAQMNSGIAALRTCQSFDFRVSAPEDALRLVASRYPQCISLAEDMGSMSISVREGSTILWRDRQDTWLLCGCSAEQTRALEIDSR